MKRGGSFLPHWTARNGIYAICFRLADSLPQEELKRIRWERNDMEREAKASHRPLTGLERVRLFELHSWKIDEYLQNGYGACWLRRADIAELVANAFRRFEGEQYRLFAWCVMPNHVHVVVQLLASHALPSILQWWKGFTAHEANVLLGRTGRFWQREYYDRLIRSGFELHHHIQYAWLNPEAAGMRNWKWRWKIDDEKLLEFLESPRSPFHPAA